MTNVCMYCRNTKGTTLIEAVVAFAIVLVCIASIVLYIPLLQVKPDQPQEVHMFFQQMKEDMKEAVAIEASGNGLYILDDKHRYRYYVSNANLVRTKDGRGYEIVLQDISRIKASEKQYGADIMITDRNGSKWHTSLGYWAAPLKGEET
ncbi:ComGF family competence protein [Alteribacillus persepolensis]|nr:ComGF family competence protein [Alteribacillus persepolensis]